MQDANRTERMEILLTKAEKAEISAAAKSEGLKMGPFIRVAAIRLARS
jgi:uncharacterized protein (DUF1778 family)